MVKSAAAIDRGTSWMDLVPVDYYPRQIRDACELAPLLEVQR